MIKKYSLKILQQAINHALSLDPTNAEKITRLQGKVLEIIISPLEVNFFIGFNQGYLELLAHYEGQADTIIQSNPLGLIRLSLLPASKARSLFNDKIKLSGDIELGQQIKRLFDEIDIDWEGHLAHFTGDVVAHQVGIFFREGLAFKRHFSESMQQNFTEYLQDELWILPSREEVEPFLKEVDDLSMDVERLQAQYNYFLAYKTNHEID